LIGTVLALLPSLPKPSRATIAVAGTAARLAVFLGAGLAPVRAWQALEAAAGAGEETEVISRINRRLAGGATVPEALWEETDDQDEAWRVVAAVYDVAHVTGAPLGDALWSLSTALQERYEAERAVRAAIVAPLYTQRLLMALPLVGVLAAAGLGVNSFGFLTQSPLGWVSLGVAVFLMAAAQRWSSRLVQRALPGPGYLSPAFDLLAIASSGGAAPEVASERVTRIMAKYRLVMTSGDAVSRLASLSRSVGVPLRALAKAEASWSRSRARAEAVEKASALSVTILVPLGLLVLPAFVLVAVVPTVFALLSGVLGSGSGGLW
jgi:tight adherence protein B